MSARATRLLDANVVIRLLTGQPQEQQTAAVRLFERAAEGEVALGLQVLTLAEIAWVLDAVYGCSRSVIAEHLSALLETPGVVVPMRNVVENPIERFTRTGVDFADAWLAACAVAPGEGGGLLRSGLRPVPRRSVAGAELAAGYLCRAVRPGAEA